MVALLDRYVQYWSTRRLDGVIAPVQATPALALGATWNLSPLCAHTVLYNIVDSSVGALPVTFVDPAKDAYHAPEAAELEKFSMLPMQALYGTSFKKGAYDPVGGMNGLPVGVQVVGPAYAEEKVRAVGVDLGGLR